MAMIINSKLYAIRTYTFRVLCNLIDTVSLSITRYNQFQHQYNPTQPTTFPAHKGPDITDMLQSILPILLNSPQFLFWAIWVSINVGWRQGIRPSFTTFSSYSDAPLLRHQRIILNRWQGDNFHVRLWYFCRYYSWKDARVRPMDQAWIRFLGVMRWSENTERYWMDVAFNFMSLST